MAKTTCAVKGCEHIRLEHIYLTDGNKKYCLCIDHFEELYRKGWKIVRD